MAQFEKFRSMVSNDASIQERVKSGEGIMDIAKSLGFCFSQEEFNNQMEALGAEDAELNDFELEMIAGGESGVGPEK